MPSMEESFESACNDGKIPGAVLMATDKTEDGQKTPLQMDAVMMMASCTKLLTTIAVLQCVERGLVGLDDDVSPNLPELAELEILTGMDSSTDEPVLKKRQNAITLRHLLTHSSGLIYDFLSPLHQQYHTHLNKPALNANPTITTRFNEPLLSEPGTSWHYSSSIDWAGLLVTRLTQSPDLESYMQKHIFSPFSITDLTFFPSSNPAIAAKMTDMSIRDPTSPNPSDPSSKVLPYTGPPLFAGVTEPMGGQGIYGSMPSYLKILRSILADDGTLLQPATTAMMFQPQLTKESQAVIQDVFTSTEKSGVFVGEWPKQATFDWGLGGVLNMEDLDLEGEPKVGGEAGWRRKGCLIWGGLPNLAWFIDRTANLCGIYGGQVLPPGDLQTKEMILLFEKTMYERSGQQRGGEP